MNDPKKKLRVQLAGIRDRNVVRRLRADASGLDLARVAKGTVPDLVILPYIEYSRLHDEADQRGAREAFERTKDEEFVPIEIADQLLRNENPIRVWRKYRGLTLAELGARTGLGKGYLSDLERGRRSGTLATLRAIAKTLDVDLDDL
jgi:DNA-binding XRE family transcriptional regulator